jgi:hypothetical protein
MPVTIAVTVFLVDLFTPRGLAASALYVLVPAACLWVPHALMSTRLALPTSALVTITYLSDTDIGVPTWISLTNTIVAIVLVWSLTRLRHTCATKFPVSCTRVHAHATIAKVEISEAPSDRLQITVHRRWTRDERWGSRQARVAWINWSGRTPAFGRGLAAHCRCRVRRYTVVRRDSAAGNIQARHFAPPLLRGGIPVCAYPLSLRSGSNGRSCVE